MIYDFSALDPAGEPVWYFLAVPQSRSEKFLTMTRLEGMHLDMKRYGRILASGKGEKAPESVRREIMEKYSAAG